MAISKQRLLEMVQASKNRTVFSDFIAIGESDLYDYSPVRRAVLREIAYMQCQDEEKSGPEGSPFKDDYVGWCWASQRYLASRVGTTEDYVRHSVKLFERDGIIETREWVDQWGTRHLEYHVHRDMVDQHKRPDGHLKNERKQPRRGGNEKANAGSFKAGNTAAKSGGTHRTPQPLPPDTTAVCHRTSQPLNHRTSQPSSPDFAAVSDTAVKSGKAVRNSGGKQGGFVLGSSTSDSELASAPPAAGTSNAHGRHESQNQKAKPSGVSVGIITKGEKAPLRNRDTYVDLYEAWKKRKAAGHSKLPTCNRCHATIQWNEPAHECEGFIPIYDEIDWDLRDAKWEQLEDAKWEDFDDRVVESHTCPECGEFVDEEDAVAHMEECSAR